jgi:hypothetical protein
MWKYVLFWFPMVAIAVANGALRQTWYGQHLSELRAHQISTLTAVLAFSVYIWVVVRRWRPDSAAKAFAVGMLWLVMTVAFEFLFGRYVAGHTWERLLHDYDLLAGRLWIGLLIWVAVAPYLFFRLQTGAPARRR